MLKMFIIFPPFSGCVKDILSFKVTSSVVPKQNKIYKQTSEIDEKGWNIESVNLTLFNTSINAFLKKTIELHNFYMRILLT